MNLHKYLKGQSSPTGVNFYDHICKVKEKAGKWLKPLDKNGISHSKRIEEYLNKLIPDEFIKEKWLSPAEVFVLLYAVYLHDIGYIKDDGTIDPKDHPKRSGEKIRNNWAAYCFSSEFFPPYQNEHPRAAEAVAIVCESHAPEVVCKLNKIPQEFSDQALDSKPLNLKRLTALLRLADEADDPYTRGKASQSYRKNVVLVEIKRDIIVWHWEADKWNKGVNHQEIGAELNDQIGEKEGLLKSTNEYLREFKLDKRLFLEPKLSLSPSEIQTRVKLPEITIPSIQSVLEKDEIPDGEFSRTEPKWIDFEKDFVVEREEVDEIINKLENNNIQLVLGKPASGKSVILKNIGFKLAKKGHRVYIIELKKWSADRVESYFKEAQKIDDEGTLIIVDDAHLPEKLSKCEELIRDYRYKKLRTKLIIGAREVKGLKGSRKKASEFEKLVQTKIRAIDAAEQMIYLFLNKKYGVSYKLRIAAVSSGLEEYKNDPWSLSWALNVFDKDTDTVRKEDIYSAINEDITEIKDGEDVFLPLSVFYRFEIPIEKRFLTKQLEIDKYSIDDLIGISEIREIKERGITMLALHHSSLASLYFETYQRTDLFPELGENIKERINEQSKYDDWERGLFYLYLKSEPTNSLDVLIRLADDWEDIKGGQALLKKLIKDERSKNSIKEGIRKEKNREKFVLCVEYITAASEEEALELVDAVSARIFFPPQIIKGRITTKKVTVGAKTGVVISGITSEEVTPDTIEHFLERIASINEKVAQKILNYLNRLSIHQKLDLKITKGFRPAWWIVKKHKDGENEHGTKSSSNG